jgi:hypothetical protein
MRFVKSLMMGIGAATLAGVILTVTMPKAVQAATAALVQVTNTSANQVPTLDVSKSAAQTPSWFAAAAELKDLTVRAL